MTDRMRAMLRGAGSIMDIYPDPSRYERFISPAPAGERIGDYWNRVGKRIRDASPEVLPGAAERIMRMAEKEQAMAERDRASAREVEEIAVRLAAADNRCGQVFGFLVALAAFGIASYLGYLGYGTAAAIVGGGTVVALVTVFVTGRHHRRYRPLLSGLAPAAPSCPRPVQGSS